MDKYLVRDKGYEIINQSSGKAFATDDGRTWVNLDYAGVVALQKVWADSLVAMQKMGEAYLAFKQKEEKKDAKS